MPILCCGDPLEGASQDVAVGGGAISSADTSGHDFGIEEPEDGFVIIENENGEQVSLRPEAYMEVVAQRAREAAKD